MKPLHWRAVWMIAAFTTFLSIWLSTAACLANTVREQYQKVEYQIPMRDGVKLYTAVYVPRCASTRNTYPFLMQRTCFGSTPYGPQQYKDALGPSPTLQADGYIFVYQDVRGRWASEGHWTNMTPVVSDRPNPSTASAIDESTDTYDTIDWLLSHVPYHTRSGRIVGHELCGVLRHGGFD
ncbi:CocE/NonD family hydrolase [Spirosoma profusum]|uniref:CocE/NonD family hydrolase n=1 Tax=Spirosoma profusum TaxID=2771354 RepID=UPI00293BC845|nr:CocE/NonD family hydrolase [Spirosoma profusum]